MDLVVSTLFRVIFFPCEGKIVKLDQLDYSPVDPRATLDSIVPLVDNPPLTENLGVRMYSSLVGTFNLPPPTARIDTISSTKDPLRKEFVQAHYFLDPGALSSSVTTSDDSKVGGIKSLMSAVEPRCESISNSTDDHPTPSPEKELDGDVAHIRTLDSTSVLDYLDIVFPLDEVIFEAMTAVDRPLEDLPHHLYFCPPLREVESRSSSLASHVCMVPLAPTHLSTKGSILIGSIIVPNNIPRSKLAEPPDQLYLKMYFS